MVIPSGLWPGERVYFAHDVADLAFHCSANHASRFARRHGRCVERADSLPKRIFLLTICIAGAVVCLRRHQLRKAMAVLSIGLPAALSLLPYVDPMRQAQSWWIVSKTGVNFLGFLFRIAEATGMLVGVWVVLVLIAALFGIGCILIKTSPDETRVHQAKFLSRCSQCRIMPRSEPEPPRHPPTFQSLQQSGTKSREN